MRIARVIGSITLNRRVPQLKAGQYLLAEVLDAHALARVDQRARRGNPMPESLVVFDQMGAGLGQLIAVSEGAEATMPFLPEKVPLDAYAAAILDQVEFESEVGDAQRV